MSAAFGPVSGKPPLDWRYESGLPGIVWPALPVPQAAGQLALLFQMEQSQWWPTEAILARQFDQLHALLAHAEATVPFYRERLTAAGFSRDRPLTPAVFSRIALLRRSELQQRAKDLQSNAPPPRHGALNSVQSSGSTGVPVTVVGNGLTQFVWNAITLRDHLWHRRDLGAKLAAIRYLDSAPPEGIVADGWGGATDGVCRSGPAAALHIGTDIVRQVEWLHQTRPDYLLSYPSNVLALARHCLERGIALPGLREVRTLSEVLGPEVRAACREAWGVPVSDIYSAMETGYLALQCPHHEHYHVQSEAVLLEVLDAGNMPCGPGEVGRVVVTLLHNFAMPLIRYEIGDYAEVGEPCACGRGLPVLSRIVGRSRNLLTRPDGSRHWPSFPASVWAHIGSIRQCQLIQHDLHTIEARLVCDRPMTADEERAFADILGKRFGHPFDFVFNYVPQIERSKGGKFEDFMSRLG